MRTQAATIGVVACGALSSDLTEIIAQQSWSIDIHPLPPLLHNHPERIAAQVEQKLGEIAPRYERVYIAYADCGTYGALDEVCQRLGVQRLAGQDCYDIYAGTDTYRELLRQEPGTYLLTDFLAGSFHRSVVVELGLDRYPELRDDYFGNYRRVVWLTQRRTPVLHQAAQQAADIMGLPLEVLDVGAQRLRDALQELVESPQRS